MTAYVALIRAVNVSGTGKLPKEDLKAMGEACGFGHCRTFINSGNLLFTTDLHELEAKARMAGKVAGYFGKPVPVFVRSAKDMAKAVAQDPFTDDKPSRRFAFFIDEKPSKEMLEWEISLKTEPRKAKEASLAKTRQLCQSHQIRRRRLRPRLRRRS